MQKDVKLIKESIIGNQQQKVQPRASAKTKTSVDVKIFEPILPIASIEQMTTLEQMLATAENREAFVTKINVTFFSIRFSIQFDYILQVQLLSKIGGKSGNKDGNQVASVLSDYCIQRMFLTTCSWTGMSTTLTQKHSFKQFENFVNCFYEAIHLADSKYALLSMQKFFKKILGRSQRRAAQKW